MTSQQEQLEQQKADYEAQVLQNLLADFPPDQRQSVAQIGGMGIVALGYEAPSEHLSTLENGFDRIRAKLGDKADRVFAGLTIYLVDATNKGGGQALAREGVVIVNTAKMGITVSEMEETQSATGEYGIGDQSNLVGGDADASKLGFVHELGHILEYRAHGDHGLGFQHLNQAEAPTKYGREKPLEDYPESWLYFVYDGHIDSERKATLERDIERVAAAV